jgi:hypothetical protein
MKLKLTPAGVALAFTILYAIIVFIVILLDIRSNLSSAVLAPIFILMLLSCKGMGCVFPFGSGGWQPILGILIYIIWFTAIFLFFWAIIKIIFLIINKLLS